MLVAVNAAPANAARGAGVGRRCCGLEKSWMAITEYADHDGLEGGLRKRPRRPDYGFDGNMIGLVAMGVVVAALVAAAALKRAGHVGIAAVAAIVAVYLVAMIGFYLHTTRQGKFDVWSEILDALRLRGDERVLDAGCGRGAVLTMVGKHLPRGSAIGVDIWSKRDQSGNCLEATERNLAAEGVHKHCKAVTGDMRAMPFPDASFDLAVSSLAIHNIFGRAGRRQAVAEIARVLKPGGRVAIADVACTRTHKQQLEQLGFVDVKGRGLGWRFWWGPGFPTTTLVIGTKPRSDAGSPTPTVP
ncbi:MAG TPA: class I SAM-dependent methyltransferase [Bryobacteraceae bacterium]|nr:class I SAM-dependent methyltransferase [Bryobacteraceae bacterium]